MVMARLSESLGTQQSVGEVEQQPRGHEGSERKIENHGSLLKACRRRTRSPPTAQISRGPRQSGSSPTWSAPLQNQFTRRTRSTGWRERLTCINLCERFCRRPAGAYVALIAIKFLDGSKGDVIGIS